MNTAHFQSRGLAVLLVVVVTLLVYGQVTGFDLINYDDPYFVTLNDHVNSGLTWDNFLWSWQSREMGIWHPLTWISFQLETSLFGADNASARHTVNLILHLGNCLLVYFILRSLLQRNGVALVVALLFATHPQHVQVVAWVAERKELLAAFFFFLTLRIYVHWRFQSRHPAWYAAALVSYILAVLSKPNVVPLPLILILIDWFFRERNPYESRFVGHLLLNKIPFVVVAVVVAAIAVFLKETGGMAEYVQGLPLLNQIMLIPLGLAHYLHTTIIPQPYPFFIGAPQAITSSMLLLSFSIIVLFAIGARVFSRRQPLVAFGVLWFLFLWLPVSGIVTVSYYFIADRYTYLPHIGLFIAIVLAVESLLERLPHPRSWMLGLGVFAIATTTVLANVQAGYWQNSIKLFERELVLNPQSDVAAFHVGDALAKSERYQEAIPYFHRAISNNPGGFLSDLYFGHSYEALAYSLESLGRTDEAIASYRKAIASRVIRGKAHGNLGTLLAKNGEVDAGLAIINQGRALFPDDMELLRHQAYWLGFGKHNTDLAIEIYTRILGEDPDDTHTLHALATLHSQVGENDKAEGYLQRYLLLQPDNREVEAMLQQLRSNKR